MKPIRPTRRLKKRHIVVRFLKGEPKDPIKWTLRKIRVILGEWGLAAAAVRVEGKDGAVLISVNREWADLVAGALVLGREDFVPVTHISGTVKSLKRKGVL